MENLTRIPERCSGSIKRIYISCLCRQNLLGTEKIEEAGKIYILDWDTKTLLSGPYGVNPGYEYFKSLGRSHGARGIVVYKDLLYVAGSGSLLSKYDLNTFDLVETLSFKEFKFLHQIKVKNDCIYIASAGNDKRFILRDDIIVDELDLSTFKDILDPIYCYHTEWGQDRLHFNSISWDEVGDEYHIYYNPGAVFNVTKGQVVYANRKELDCVHDIVFLDNNIIINSSNSKNTKLINRATKNVRTIYEANTDITCSDINLSGFTRALAVCSFGLFVGSSPGRLVLLDSKNFLVKEVFDFSIDKNESIYDIFLNPSDWS